MKPPLKKPDIALVIVLLLLCITTVWAAVLSVPATAPPQTVAVVYSASVTTSAEISHKEEKININTADATALTALDGIGDVIANRIVTYREEHGAFRSVEDLLKVKGIGEKRLQAIRDHITL